MTSPQDHSPAAGSPLRVLLVDDDSADRRIISRCLDKSGLDVELVETFDVPRVLELARSGQVSCVLMDFRLPGGESFDLFKELFDETCETRSGIVLLTGRGDERIAAEAIQRGAQEYLAKAELTPESLRGAIEGAIKKAGLCLELAQRDKQLHRMSFYDSLTELPNRQLFMDRLDQQLRHASRTGEPFSVLMMDLNGFKQVNDGFGHHAGDRLLAETAARLRQAVRDSDTVARLGGDEFAGLLPKTGSVDGIYSVARKIRSALDAEVIVDGHAHRVGVALGAAIYPDHGENPEELLRVADMAMYEDKRGGGNALVCGIQPSTEDARRSTIREHLAGALNAEDQFFLAYQPKVCLESGQIAGVEALLRWQHPELGLLTPDEIFPAVRRSRSMLVDLTLKTLELALSQGAAWHCAGRPVELSLNLSPALFQDLAAAEKVCAWLAARPARPGPLCLEITEDAFLPAPDAACQVLLALVAQGFAFAIDDFGSGFSSLKLLRDLPISELKIDPQFGAALVAAPADASVVDSIISLGRCFDIRVVAEGVEDQRMQDELMSRGCRFGQGFHLASPMSAGELESWWAGRRTGPVLYQPATLRRLPVEDPAFGAARNDSAAAAERDVVSRGSR